MARSNLKTTPTPRAPEQPQWPADKVERWEVARLLPYARNARMHSEDQVAKLAASIKEFGWTVPVVVDEQGNLIAGHGRVLAAKQLGLAAVPTIVARGWSEERKKAYRLADNKHAETSEWDEGLLKAELLDLKDFDLVEAMGFDDDEVDELLDVAEVTPESGKSSRGGGAGAVIQFNIVFDDEAQQQSWFAFVKALKVKYPDLDTLGARLAKHIQESGHAEG